MSRVQILFAKMTLETKKSLLRTQLKQTNLETRLHVSHITSKKRFH